MKQQLGCLLADVTINGTKIGMLTQADTVEIVVELLFRRSVGPIVLDPVLFATNGAPLLDPDGLCVLRKKLWPLATLATPNLSEAQALSEMEVDTIEKMRICARLLASAGPKAVLVKGGHLSGDPVDVLCVDDQILELPGSRVAKPLLVHGTGCALASAAAAFLAEGRDMVEAVTMAKSYVTGGIARAKEVGRGAAVLDYKAAAEAVGR